MAKKNTPANSPKLIPITVSARILRHISRGIYRTPAGALKELISNSYDAGALEVTVNTGWPSFNEMVVTDNGSGMSSSEFEKLVQRIGLSQKSAGEEFTIRGTSVKRTRIGHYGIGLLAVGQLAAKMTIRSKVAGQPSGFRAELDFEQFEVDKTSKRARIVSEESIESQASDTTKTKFPIGRCKIWSESYEGEATARSFTRITLTELRDETVRKIRGTHRDEHNPEAALFQQYSSTYGEILALIRAKEGEARQGIYPYEKLVWELGMYCPLPYPQLQIFEGSGGLAEIAKLANRSNFSLKVDGAQILKPIDSEFFGDDFREFGHTFTWKNERYSDEGAKGPRVSGYLVFQPRIRPKLLQGVLVREGGVAVGGYDTTYLEYPLNEGMKFTQLSGELFVDGLSGALNIDRNSFNETDDRYMALASWLHGKLRKEVFPRIKSIQKNPASKKRKESQAKLQGIAELLASQLGKNTKILFKSLGKDEPLFSQLRGKLVINTDHPDGSGSGGKREKLLLAAGLVLSEQMTVAEFEHLDGLIADSKKEYGSQ